MKDRKANRLIGGAPLRARPALAEPPRLSVRRLEALDAAAELDRVCATRPLKPPPMPRDNHTRSVGACELAREIRRGSYVP